jgi:hypothetical protein
MDNALLVGLSRQMALGRELDVIANNMANVTTNGFKGRESRSQEFTMPVARANTFKPQDRALSFVVDAGTTLDTSLGAIEATGNALDAAIKGDRRALHPQRRLYARFYWADRHERRPSGTRRERPDHDRPAGDRGCLRARRDDLDDPGSARPAAAGPLRQRQCPPKRRRQPLLGQHSGPAGWRDQPDRSRHPRALQRQADRRDDPADRGEPCLHLRGRHDDPTGRNQAERDLAPRRCLFELRTG